MRGFVLAAGFGTRLRPLSNFFPKALVSVCGKPLLERNLKYLASQKFKAFAVNSHYLHEQLKIFATSFNIPFRLFHEETIRGTGGALYYAKEFLKQDDYFFVMNVDIINTFDIKKAASIFEASQNICSLLSQNVKSNGTIIYNPGNNCFIGTKDNKKKDTPDFEANFTGCAFYRKEFLELIKEDDFSIKSVWKRAVEKGLHVGVQFVDGYWRDVGTPEALAQIHFDMLENVVDMDHPSDLIIDRDRKICYHNQMNKKNIEKLKPLSWVEQNYIPENVTVSQSVILPNSNLKPGLTERKIIGSWGEISF
ncbi:NDP-sugar synthase [Chitinispirillales bacterium ANBcel5]|uniref:nucleotidyltransferase family protein n=1 Tax=Cellulosispirillum alkaliphilum TaxID=3039283 RepID=UPI002A52A444|nr:NDP-sugar synthase [Chitinispirillales bacterium ANBcel5]